jgi:hypothetical protein
MKITEMKSIIKVKPLLTLLRQMLQHKKSGYGAAIKTTVYTVYKCFDTTMYIPQRTQSDCEEEIAARADIYQVRPTGAFVTVIPPRS